MPTTRSLTRGQADAVVVAVQFFSATSFLVTKITTDEMPPLTFVFLRFGIAALFLTLISPAVWRALTPALLKAGAVLRMTLAGGIILMTIGLRTEPSGQTAFVVSLSCLLVPLVDFLVTRVAPDRGKVLRLIIATVGLGFISLNEALQISLGTVWLIISTVLFASYTFLVSHLAPRFDNRAITVVQLAAAAGLALLCSLPAEEQSFHFSAKAWLAVAYLGVWVTAVRFTIQNYAQRFTTATDVALLFTLEPVLAGIYGWLLAEEVMNGQKLTGCALILFGLVYAKSGVWLRRRL